MLDLIVVGTVPRTEIIGAKVPDDAEYGMLNPQRDAIQKVYKYNEHGILVYWGEQGGWHYSNYNVSGRDHDKLKDCLFVHIADV